MAAITNITLEKKTQDTINKNKKKCLLFSSPPPWGKYGVTHPPPLQKSLCPNQSRPNARNFFDYSPLASPLLTRQLIRSHMLKQTDEGNTTTQTHQNKKMKRRISFIYMFANSVSICLSKNVRLSPTSSVCSIDSTFKRTCFFVTLSRSTSLSTNLIASTIL